MHPLGCKRNIQETVATIQKMKKILKFIGVVGLNILLIFFALILHYRITDKIIRKTEIKYAIAPVIPFFLFLFILAFFFSKLKFRNYAIGLATLLAFSFSFLLYFTNSKITTIGEYKSYRLRNAISEGNSFYLDVAYEVRKNTIKVTQEKCLYVDSVQLRVDNGLFGMKTITNNVRIEQGKNCSNSINDKDYGLREYIKSAHDLAKKRCFTNAIDLYSKCLTNDPFNKECYYHRGLMYIAIRDYKKAIVDFLMDASIRSFEISDIDLHKDHLIVELETKDFTNINKIVDSINNESLSKRIIFCLEKINTN